MKLRYYLRGLGIGMFVTALLMGITLGDRQPLSDAEIRVRAMELGMVDGDSRTLADNQTPQDPEQYGSVPTATPSPEPSATRSPEPTSPPTATPVPEETAAPGADTSKPLPMVTLKPSEEPPESVTIVVQRGQGSYGVAKNLMEAGLVEDASAFDLYLEENGYSKRINPGTYEIPVDSTEEEIAKIITKSR